VKDLDFKGHRNFATSTFNKPLSLSHEPFRFLLLFGRLLPNDDPVTVSSRLNLININASLSKGDRNALQITGTADCI
jgi:hypothetical protein